MLRQHGEEQRTGKNSFVVLRMHLAGGNLVPALVGQGELPGKSNYLIGNDPSKWRTGVANFGQVAEKDVYPGIDLVYHGNQGQLEYDFDVAPHADPRKIRFALDGAKDLRVDAQGDLLVTLAGGELQIPPAGRLSVAGWQEKSYTRPLQLACQESGDIPSGVLRCTPTSGD